MGLLIPPEVDETRSGQDASSSAEHASHRDFADAGSESSANDCWRVDIGSVSSNSIAIHGKSERWPYWPHHDIQSRARFRMHMNRYYDQLLYGCSEPNCQTHSCVSYRKREAKGPFRPYTVLTARALSITLAAQDDPEHGLCQHRSARNENSTLVPDTGGKSQANVSSFRNTSNLATASDTYGSSKETSDEVEDNQRDPPVSAVDPEMKERDFKSFAQSLFDTRAMRQFKMGKPSSAANPKSKVFTQAASDSDGMLRDHYTTFNETKYVLNDQTNPAINPSPKDYEKNQANYWQKQQDAHKAIYASDFPSIFRSMVDNSQDSHPDQFLMSDEDFVLSHFSVCNLLTLFERAWTPARSLQRMLTTFNRPLSLSILKQANPSYNAKDAQYIRFIHRSMDYLCNTPYALMRSFLEWRVLPSNRTWLVRSHSLATISSVFHLFTESDIFTILLTNSWACLELINKPCFDSLSQDETPESLQNEIPYASQLSTDAEVAHISTIVLAVLTSYVGLAVNEDLFSLIVLMRRDGDETLPSYLEVPSADYYPILELMDKFENAAAVSLATRFAKGLGFRRWEEITRSQGLRKHEPQEKARPVSAFMALVVRNIADSEGVGVLVDAPVSLPSFADGSLSVNYDRHVFAHQNLGSTWKDVIVEWMRTVIIKEWDGKAEVPRRSAIGGALEFLRHMYLCCSTEEVPEDTFYTPYLYKRLDIVDFPLLWAEGKTRPDMVHLLSYPFLFRPSLLIMYFRAINHRAMTKAFQAATVNENMLAKMNFSTHPHGPHQRGAIRMFDNLLPSVAKYLTLDIRREHIFEDAIKHLWRRKPHELLKPLKIRLGMNRGEEGVDLGGVSQEFFRLAIAEALDPKYGAFTTDPATRMAWFQPGSLEPLHIFETVGILTSLAVYNGLTLPFTFPKAFYRAIANLPCETIADVSDGWPSLARGLQALLDWPDDDVEEVFMRPYTFSTNIFGSVVDVDLTNNTKQTPSSPPNQPPSPTEKMVTNKNRKAFVRDYIIHLTHDSVQPQLDAFLAGFRRCLPPPVHELFTENSLKELIEGQSVIDTHDLERVTQYESGYSRDHPTIRQFWEVVHEWGAAAAADDVQLANSSFFDNTNNNTSEANGNGNDNANGNGNGTGQDLVRKLLEFVTASDRLPVGGVERVQFVIQRNGEGDERLPTSYTCFGRLLLPEFSGVEALRTGLRRAMEESLGFGLQ